MPTSPIALSAGHGKYIRGASDIIDEVDEARRVCTQVSEELKRRGVTVRGPYFDNQSTTQSENLNRITNWHNGQDRRLDVSVHFNSSGETTSSPIGTEVLYVTQEALAAKTSAAIAAAGHLKDRGAKYRSDLFVLNNTDEPAVLLEIVFVNSVADVELYRENFSAICSAIADALSGVTADAPAERPPPPTSGLEPDERGVVGIGETGDEVYSIQQTLGLPADGYFGPVTEAGVKGFQRAHALSADGIVGEATWVMLDDLDARMAAGSDGISDELGAQIDLLAGNSPLMSYDWDDRGQAPPGYYAGMCKVYALALQRYDRGDPAARIMAEAAGDPDLDALAWYGDEFFAADMPITGTGPETLRALFVLMVGLSMREASGNHWVGRDMSATNVESDTAEAGLFQASWNLASASDTIPDLLNQYEADPNGFRPTFGKGLEPEVMDLDNYGSADGCFYQFLSKFCPAFATLMAGVGLRRRRQHWGPINRKEVELVRQVDDLLLEVERLLAATPSV